jgi:hypothetical protein
MNTTLYDFPRRGPPVLPGFVGHFCTMCAAWNRFLKGRFLDEAPPDFIGAILAQISLTAYRQLMVTFLSECRDKLAHIQPTDEEKARKAKMKVCLLKIINPVRSVPWTDENLVRAFCTFSIFHGLMQEMQDTAFLRELAFVLALVNIACTFPPNGVMVPLAWHIIELITAPDSQTKDDQSKFVSDIRAQIEPAIDRYWREGNRVQRLAVFPFLVRILPDSAPHWIEASEIFFQEPVGTGLGPLDSFGTAYVTAFRELLEKPRATRDMRAFVEMTVDRVIDTCFVPKPDRPLFPPDNRHIIDLWQVILENVPEPTSDRPPAATSRKAPQPASGKAAPPPADKPPEPADEAVSWSELLGAAIEPHRDKYAQEFLKRPPDPTSDNPFY